MAKDDDIKDINEVTLNQHSLANLGWPDYAAVIIRAMSMCL
jgi:hypothetical protein